MTPPIKPARRIKRRTYCVLYASEAQSIVVSIELASD